MHTKAEVMAEFDSLFEPDGGLPKRNTARALELCHELNEVIWQEGRAPEADEVNHPSHYTAHPSGIECIQVTEFMNFCLGNAVKYIWRAGEKDGTSAVTDLRKSLWYINREIERLENDAGTN